MKKLIVLAFSVVCVLCLAGCSVKEATVWDWAQGLKQEDIVSASPWGEGNNFDALSQEETTELVILINNLTKNCFTKNSDLEGGTPTFGIQIDTATKTFYINESIAPSGALEIEYDKTMWWIDNTELLDFIRKVTGDNTGLDDEDISGRAETSSGEQSNDPSLQDISVSVSEAGGGDTFELLGKNAETISQILSADSWVPDATNCASDYIVTYNGRTIYYHSECGTFNERLEQSNQSLRLSETDRETVNTIIQGAIPRDLNLDAPYVNTETSKVNTPAISTLETRAFPVNGKPVVGGYRLVLCAAPVFLAIVPVFMVAGAGIGFGLAERAAKLLAQTLVAIGCLSILVHSQARIADRIAGR